MLIIILEGGYIGVCYNIQDVSKLLHKIVSPNNKILDISIYVLSENNKIIIEKMFINKKYNFSKLVTDNDFDDIERTEICKIITNSNIFI